MRNEQLINEMMNTLIRKFGFKDIRTVTFNGLLEYEVEETIIFETYERFMELDLDL